MRDDDERAGVALQPVLDPDDRVEVEMVGRLVEQQQVGRAHERLREVQPHAPAAREARDRLRHLLVREAQAAQQLLRARAHRVGVGVAQRGVELAHAHAVVGGFGRPRAPSRAGAMSCRRRSRTRAPGGRARASPAPRARCASARDSRLRPGRRAARRAGARTGSICRCRWRRSGRSCRPGFKREVGAFEQDLGAAYERELGEANHGRG